MKPALTAVVLARGLGRRMQADDPGVTLPPGAVAAATAGIKTLVPDALGRPLLDHILTSLADAGIVRVVLVVAPDHQAIVDHLSVNRPARLKIDCAVQHQPLGTADALLAAAAAVADQPFLVLNADNLYPVEALRMLAELDRPGLIGFERSALVEGGIPADRVQAFALVAVRSDGNLSSMIEKPSHEEMAALGADAPVSMNLWRFDHGIFSACQDVEVSPRGERELPQAVALHLSRGATYAVVPYAGRVLDLSRRSDIEAVGRILASLRVAT
jgi:glucose-1-phosphate thymidylyltransferase